MNRTLHVWLPLSVVGWLMLITGSVLDGPQPELSGAATLLFVALVGERIQYARQQIRRHKADALCARADASHTAALTPEDRAWLREHGWNG